MIKVNYLLAIIEGQKRKVLKKRLNLSSFRNYKRIGGDTANQRFVYLKNLPVTFIKLISESYLTQSGRLKAQCSILLLFNFYLYTL